MLRYIINDVLMSNNDLMKLFNMWIIMWKTYHRITPDKYNLLAFLCNLITVWKSQIIIYHVCNKCIIYVMAKDQKLCRFNNW